MARKVALIFPGQGAQKVGMGKEFFDQIPEARHVFDKANEVIGEDLARVIFDGPEEKLMSTAYCQPAIFTMSMAALAAFRASAKFSDVSVACTAGLSLGEYSALCAAGSITFEDCLRLIQRRGAFMEEAARVNPGKMAAVIGFDPQKLADICAATGAEIANFNAPDQIVITGTPPCVEKACAMIAAAGGRKVIPLDVSGAFHSSLMSSAAQKFAQAVAHVPLQVTGIRVVTNVNALPQASIEEIRLNLPRQICSSVQWVDSIKFIASQGITDLIEIGPGRVLKGLLRKIDPALNVQNIQIPDDVVALTF